MYRFMVATKSSRLCGAYARHHIEGYTLWRVNVSRFQEVTSVKLVKENLAKPSAQALKNYEGLHNNGII